jgi:hypothetical protein
VNACVFVWCVSVAAFERARPHLQTLPKITEEIQEAGRNNLLHEVMMYALEHNKGPKKNENKNDTSASCVFGWSTQNTMLGEQMPSPCGNGSHCLFLIDCLLGN